MVDPMEWLGTWEPIESVGKHTSVVPAAFAHGYQYRMPEMDRRPKWYSPVPVGVSRAIPVDGSVKEPEKSWARSPQARFWLEEPKKPLGARIREWLRRSAAT